VRLSPLGTLATNWSIVPAPDDRWWWWWLWSSRWNENWQGKPKHSEKTCPSATLFATNPTWPDLGSNPGRLGGKPATNRLSYGTANANRIFTLHFLLWQTRVWWRNHIGISVTFSVKWMSLYNSRYQIMPVWTCLLVWEKCNYQM
jgi:hypothetical protein